MEMFGTGYLKTSLVYWSFNLSEDDIKANDFGNNLEISFGVSLVTSP